MFLSLGSEAMPILLLCSSQSSVTTPLQYGTRSEKLSLELIIRTYLNLVCGDFRARHAQKKLFFFFLWQCLSALSIDKVDFWPYNATVATIPHVLL